MIPPKFYVYAVVMPPKETDGAPTPVAVRLTRQAANQYRDEQSYPADFRVRRAKLILFET